MNQQQWVEQIQSETCMEKSEKFALRLANLWLLYGDKSGPNMRLRYLYVKRHGIQSLVGEVWREVNWKESDVEQDDDQKFKHLCSMIDDCDTQIDRLERSLNAVRCRAAPITATSLVQGQPGYPNPTDTRYLGDPTKPQSPIR